jgi:hypothetical protein
VYPCNDLGQGGLKLGISLTFPRAKCFSLKIRVGTCLTIVGDVFLVAIEIFLARSSNINYVSCRFRIRAFTLRSHDKIYSCLHMTC